MMRSANNLCIVECVFVNKKEVISIRNTFYLKNITDIRNHKKQLAECCFLCWLNEILGELKELGKSPLTPKNSKIPIKKIIPLINK